VEMLLGRHDEAGARGVGKMCGGEKDQRG
jgi:hypothetical protein